MTIVEKQCSYGPARAYKDAPERLKAYSPGDRVQPAPFAGTGRVFVLREAAAGSVLAVSGGVVHEFDDDQVVLWEEGLPGSPAARPAARGRTKRA